MDRRLILRRILPAALVAAFACLLPVLSQSARGDPPTQPCDLVASTAGDDGAPGTLTQPFRTVQKLADSLAPGQTGCLRGTAAANPFSENVTVQNKNVAGATDATRITIRNYPGEVAKLAGRLVVSDTANGISFTGLVLDGRDAIDPQNGQASPAVDGDDVRFQDDVVTGGGEVDCFSLGSSPGALAWRTLLQRVRVKNCLEGVQARYSRAMQLRDSIVYDNNGAGLHLGPDGDSSFVRRVILDANKPNVLFSGDSVNTSTGNILTHNLLSNPAAGQPNVTSSWDSLNRPSKLLNNVRYTCAYAPSQAYSGLATAQGGFGLRYLTIPPSPDGPRYADRAHENFHINATSACYTWVHDVAQYLDDGGGPNVAEASANNVRPNVLFIVTDDQNADGTVLPGVMPDTVGLRDSGVDFSNAFGTTPLCCPGRAAIFSGRYGHNNGVFHNGATADLDQTTTIEARLKAAGYQTALFGKFLNNWNLNDNPPYWDNFSIMPTGGYCPFIVNEQGVRKTYPPGPDAKPVSGDGKCEPQDLGHTADAPYSTDYIRDQALSFLDNRDSSNDDQPWFMELTPSAPHTPWTPEADYANAPLPDFTPNPSTFESDISDKPSWVAQGQRTPETLFGDPHANPPTAGVRANQLRTLMSVDDMVGAVLDKLKALGEQDTLVVFTTDNGYIWGDHGLINKGFPYTESAKLPLVMRYAPDTIPGSTDDRLTSNIDLAPTALAAAGVNVPAGTFDGQSLLDPSWNRSRMETEFQDNVSGDTAEAPSGLPDWAATRTVSYHYIESYGEDGKTVQFREYYDLINDPYELNNCYGGDGVAGTADDLCSPPQNVTDLHDQLVRDRLCQGTACPPGPGASTTDDNIPPRTHMTTPTAGSRVCCKVNLSADAFDNMGIGSVTFKIDGTPVDTDTTFPYQYAWDSTGTSAGVHTVTAEATDTSGNTGSGSTDSTVSFTLTSGVDIQITNGGSVPGKIETGDVVTYSFGTPMVPSSILGGWSGAKPDCVASPTARGCVTVSVVGDGFLDELDNDTLSVFSDVDGQIPISSLGTVDLGDNDYVSYAPTVRSFTHSPMEMLNGNTVLRITLADGSVGAAGTAAGSASWTAPFCGCRVWESIAPGDSAPDRDF